MVESRLTLRIIALVSITTIAMVATACGSASTLDSGGTGVEADAVDSGSGAPGTGEDDAGTSAGKDGGSTGQVDGGAIVPDDDGGPAPEPAEDTTACSPDCEGRVCGSDQCSGSCGTCDDGATCTDAGQCEPAACEPDCASNTCGDDGCGGSCGECTNGEACSEGACVSFCIPNCSADAECGDDGCGGSCGECSDDLSCNEAGECVLDPCDPNPCVTPPADKCEGGAPVNYDEVGECIPMGDGHSCGYDFTEGEVCADGTFCSEGECLEEVEPGEFGEDASLINEMIIAGANEPEKCCFDFDGDGQIDNGIGDLLGNSLLSGQLPDIDGPLAEAIAEGSVSIIMEGKGLDDLVNDDDVSVNGYVAYFDDDGSLLVQPGSFNENGTPLVHFPNGEIVDGVAHMGPSDFQTSLPMGGIVLSLNVKDAIGQTEVSEGAGGKFDMSDGRLGGLIPFGDIISTLNEVSGSCECLDLNGGDMFDLDDEESASCSSAFNSANPTCGASDGSLCEGLAGIIDQSFLVCSLGLSFIKPDIDTDFNGKGDHFSVGIRFSGEATEIDGLGEDQSLGGCSDCSGGGGPLNGLAHLALFAMCFAFVTRKRRV